MNYKDKKKTLIWISVLAVVVAVCIVVCIVSLSGKKKKDATETTDAVTTESNASEEQITGTEGDSEERISDQTVLSGKNFEYLLGKRTSDAKEKIGDCGYNTVAVDCENDDQIEETEYGRYVVKNILYVDNDCRNVILYVQKFVDYSSEQVDKENTYNMLSSTLDVKVAWWALQDSLKKHYPDIRLENDPLMYEGVKEIAKNDRTWELKCFATATVRGKRIRLNVQGEVTGTNDNPIVQTSGCAELAYEE